MLIKWDEINSKFVIDEFTYQRFKSIYPAVDKELIKMELWYIANPKKKKKNHYRFIVNWLSRESKATYKQFTGRDYSRDNDDFAQKIEIAKQEAAPPPSEWEELKRRLKGA